MGKMGYSCIVVLKREVRLVIKEKNRNYRKIKVSERACPPLTWSFVLDWNIVHSSFNINTSPS